MSPGVKTGLKEIFTLAIKLTVPGILQVDNAELYKKSNIYSGNILFGLSRSAGFFHELNLDL